MVSNASVSSWAKARGLEFGLEAVHADPLGERRVDLHGLRGDPPPPRVGGDEVQGTHVVQAVGELDQQDADVAAHRQHQLAEVLRLLGPVRVQFELGELGHAIDEGGDLGPEAAFEVGAGDGGVFDHVVQQGGGDRGAVEPVAGQDAGDRERVGDVGVAGVALWPRCARSATSKAASIWAASALGS